VKKLFLALFVMTLVLSACGTTQTELEQAQQSGSVKAITQNQPIPDLGGYSFERQIVIETYLARNNTIATYAYMITMDGKIIEICPSVGYPIPYSTQLTNSLVPTRNCGSGSGNCTEGVVANPEINGLYPPADAAATLVQCVNPDGSVSPTYIEWYVLSFPYRIASDVQLIKIGEPSFKVNITK
jgi:hypothetical protein